MNKIVISTLLAFVIGFTTSRFFQKQSISENSQDSATEQCATLDAAKSNLISISQNEYLEYTQIKDLKQKYEKADELLGKIMLLFLADVGFKFKKETAPQQQVAAPVAATVPVANNSNQVEPSATPAPNNSSLNHKSMAIKSAQNEKRIRDELDKAVIDDPKMEVAKGEVITQRQARLLEGRYSGVINFLDGKRQSLTVTWDLMPDYTKKGLSGTFNLSIHGPGTNSDSSGRGNIGNIVSLAEDRDGFLVNGCADKCFLQLYYNAPSDQFFGNYYDVPKGASDKPQRTGLVGLKR